MAVTFEDLDDNEKKIIKSQATFLCKLIHMNADDIVYLLVAQDQKTLSELKYANYFLAALDDRTIRILEDIYSLTGKPPETFNDVKRKYGITFSEINNCINQGIEQLRRDFSKKEADTKPKQNSPKVTKEAELLTGAYINTLMEKNSDVISLLIEAGIKNSSAIREIFSTINIKHLRIFLQLYSSEEIRKMTKEEQAEKFGISVSFLYNIITKVGGSINKITGIRLNIKVRQKKLKSEPSEFISYNEHVEKFLKQFGISDLETVCRLSQKIDVRKLEKFLSVYSVDKSMSMTFQQVAEKFSTSCEDISQAIESIRLILFQELDIDLEKMGIFSSNLKAYRFQKHYTSTRDGLKIFGIEDPFIAEKVATEVSEKDFEMTMLKYGSEKLLNQEIAQRFNTSTNTVASIVSKIKRKIFEITGIQLKGESNKKKAKTSGKKREIIEITEEYVNKVKTFLGNYGVTDPSIVENFIKRIPPMMLESYILSRKMSHEDITLRINKGNGYINTSIRNIKKFMLEELGIKLKRKTDNSPLSYEDITFSDEEQERIKKLVGELDDESQKVVLLFALGITNHPKPLTSKSAKILGISEEEAKEKLRSARQKIKERNKDQSEFDSMEHKHR